MVTLPSAGVFGLVATPTVTPADPAGDVRQVAPGLLELEGAHTSPGTDTGVDRSAREGSAVCCRFPRLHLHPSSSRPG